MDVREFFTDEIKEAIRIFAIVVTFIHLVIGIILNRFVFAASSILKTPSSGFFRALGIIHLLVLVTILLIVIFFNQINI